MGTQIFSFAFGLLLIVLVVLIFFLVVFGAPILGSISRLKLTKKIITGMREGRFMNLSAVAGKIRWLSILALLSIVGMLSIIVLVLINVLPGNSKVTIALYIFFAFTGITVGTLLYREFVGRIKR